MSEKIVVVSFEIPVETSEHGNYPNIDEFDTEDEIAIKMVKYDLDNYPELLESRDFTFTTGA